MIETLKMEEKDGHGLDDKDKLRCYWPCRNNNQQLWLMQNQWFL